MKLHSLFLAAGFACVAVLAGGCATPQVAHTGPDPVSMGYRFDNVAEIGGAKGWQSSGLTMRKGTPYIVVATGQWTSGGLVPPCGPDGYASPPIEVKYDSSCNTMALIGSISGGKDFLVGGYFTGIAETDGELLLRCNVADVGLWDNAGEVLVKLYVGSQQASSAPAAPPATVYVPTPSTVPAAPAPGPGQGKAALIYVYRENDRDTYDSFPVLLDGRPEGASGPGTYFALQVAPGPHTVTVRSKENFGEVNVQAEGGRSYFLKVDWKMGAANASATLAQVPEDKGWEAIRGCALLGSGGNEPAPAPAPAPAK